jgi:hypothetical protein
VDAGSSPAGILGHHLEDEIANLFRCRLSAHGLANLGDHEDPRHKGEHTDFWCVEAI